MRVQWMITNFLRYLLIFSFSLIVVCTVMQSAMDDNKLLEVSLIFSFSLIVVCTVMQSAMDDNKLLEVSTNFLLFTYRRVYSYAECNG